MSNITCPYTALREYLETNNMKPSSLEFIFRSIVSCKDKAFSLGDKRLTYKRAREHFLRILTEIGLNAEEYGTHSLRSGGASMASEAGIPHEVRLFHGIMNTCNSGVSCCTVQDQI
uniref:Tyr recombinase domain-containing protein n=1 Tax=Romanomermis culicivorax TaxID=13658 RepID=A0A915KNY2_ROMCU